ncbi:MAG TPA: DUF308 domain-containing protein [Solirubrobacteraceae bacterium]
METSEVRADADVSEVDLGPDPRSLRWVWWLVLLIGLVGVAAGVVLIAQPSKSLSFLTILVGIVLLLESLVALFASIVGDARHRALTAIAGVLGIIVGVALIRDPFAGVTAVGILVGIWFVAAGAIGLIRVFGPQRHRLLRGLISLAEIAIGIFIVSKPHIGYTTLAIIAGIWLILSGIGTLFFALAVRRATA